MLELNKIYQAKQKISDFVLKTPLTHSHFLSDICGRRQKGVSQLDLSLAIGYKSVSLVAGAEAGYKNIHFNLEQLYRIAHALDVDIAVFFEFE